ncbi:MAG: hypothetical protein GWP48_08350 [Actinobacteria bacterium]|nr:hypothetical protein [Actinomycetota bacterium]
MNEEVWWYATRGAGLMTWVTACGSVLIGLLLSGKSIKSLDRPWFFDLHRFLSSVSMIFLVTHLGTLYMYNTEVFTWRALLIPGESTWETTAASMGIIAFWSLIAVELTSLLQDRVSNAIWRVAHGLAVVTVVAGTYHAWLGGSDVRNPIIWAIVVVGSLLAGGLIARRLQPKNNMHAGNVHKSDHEGLLVQTQAQLEGLPVGEQLAQPKLQLNSTVALPRRRPLGTTAGNDDGPITFDNSFAADPFASVPLPTAKPQSGSLASPTPDELPRSEVDPFRHNTRPTGSEETNPRSTRPRPDPFQRARHTAEAESAAASGPEKVEHRLPPRATGVNPFVSPEPPVTAFTAPPEPEPVPVPQPTITATGAPTPPPLPNESGEVDEAVYTAWLVEWLAFAEKYGNEMPEDPTRT